MLFPAVIPEATAILLSRFSVSFLDPVSYTHLTLPTIYSV